MDSGVTRKARRPTALLGKLCVAQEKASLKNPHNCYRVSVKYTSNHQTRCTVTHHPTEKAVGPVGAGKYRMVGFVYVHTRNCLKTAHLTET